MSAWLYYGLRRPPSIAAGDLALPAAPWGQWDFGAGTDSGANITINDLSGNNRHVTGGLPSYTQNSRPTIVAGEYTTFDGVEDVAAAHFAGTDPYTLIVVARADAHAGTVMGWTRDGSGTVRGQLHAIATATFGLIGLTTALNAPNNTWPVDTWAMLSTRITEGGAGSLEYNGAQVASAGTMGTASTLEAVVFGARGDGAASFFAGDVAYAVAYTRLLSDPELLTVYAWLQAELAGRGITI